MSTGLFGSIVEAGVVEDAVQDTLTLWLPTYLAEVQRQRNDTARLPAPRSYRRMDRFDSFPEDQLPAVVIVCAGTSRIVRGGRGVHEATWQVGVAVITSSSDPAFQRSLAQRYAAAVRGVLVQQGSLGGVVAATEWLDESYDQLDVADQRTLGAAYAQFSVTLDSVVTATQGPAAPIPPEPTTDWPDPTDPSAPTPTPSVATDVHVRIEKERL